MKNNRDLHRERGTAYLHAVLKITTAANHHPSSHLLRVAVINHAAHSQLASSARTGFAVHRAHRHLVAHVKRGILAGPGGVAHNLLHFHHVPPLIVVHSERGPGTRVLSLALDPLEPSVPSARVPKVHGASSARTQVPAVHKECVQR